jgi:hypothetical protein
MPWPMLDGNRECRVVVFEAAQVVAPEETGTVDGVVKGAVREAQVDVC